jgi:large subunit ribosomal protein L9
MEVILLERVEKLGKMGEVVRVRPGYARNYLLPQKKAVRATTENRRRFEEQRAHLELDNENRRTEAEALSTRLSGLTVALIRQAGEAGQLYGSVSSRDIADAVADAGFAVRRQQVNLTQPIKAVGLYDVPIALHPEVSVLVRVNVARSQDEADLRLRGETAPAEREESWAGPVDETEEPAESDTI